MAQKYWVSLFLLLALVDALFNSLIFFLAWGIVKTWNYYPYLVWILEIAAVMVLAVAQKLIIADEMVYAFRSGQQRRQLL